MRRNPVDFLTVVKDNSIFEELNVELSEDEYMSSFIFNWSFCVLTVLLLCVSSAFFDHVEYCPCCHNPVRKIPNMLRHILFGISDCIIDPENARNAHFVFKSYINPRTPPHQPISKNVTHSSLKMTRSSQVDTRFIIVFPSFQLWNVLMTVSKYVVLQIPVSLKWTCTLKLYICLDT